MDRKRHERTATATALAVLFTIIMTFAAVNPGYGEIIPGDRRITWDPGIPGGIPDRTTICANVKNAPYYAVGNGVADDTNAIQNAINNCPAGQVVYLPQGTYRTTRELVISKGIVLRGDGPARTKIKGAGSGSTGYIIGMRGPGVAVVGIPVLSGSAKGSKTITLSDASTLRIGDYIMVDQLNNPAFVNIGTCTYCSRDNGARAVRQITKITNKSGNTLTLDSPLAMTFSSQFKPEAVKITSGSQCEYAGVEDLYVERVSGGEGNILSSKCNYAWIKNIESFNVIGEHIEIVSSYRNVVRDSYIHHSQSFGSTGEGYGVSLRFGTSDALVENNIFYYLRHSMLTQGAGPGNVFGYNYSDRMFEDRYPDTQFLMADMVSHAAHPFMTLWEGNKGSRISEDNVHGSASHNTYLRNYVDAESKGERQTIANGRHPVVVQANNTTINLVGNIFGLPGDTGSYEAAGITCSNSNKYVYKLGYTGDGDCDPAGNDPNVKATILRHGNYDYITNSVYWDPNIPDHNLPGSYYLSAKPAFFGAKRWPAYGPDLAPMLGILPAEERFQVIMSGGKVPSPPVLR
jgi:hypothetical protein